MNRIENLDKVIADRENFYISQKSKFDTLSAQLDDLNIEIDDIEKQIEILQKVSILLKKVAQFARDQAKMNIEALVSNCLKYIFNENIAFKIEIKDSKKSSNAEFLLETYNDGMMMQTKPEIANGGGIVDIISLALRISFIQLHNPFIDGPIILDEPAKHVSRDYTFNVGDFLKQSAQRFDRQIIMVTHNEQLAEMADTKFNVKLNGNMTEVELISD